MKNKILDNLPMIWVMLMFILGLLLASSNAKAGPQGMANYPWHMMNVPMWCGPIEEVNNVLKKEGYVPVEVAFGRALALPDGEIAYAVTTYASSDIKGHIVRTIETPQQVDKCILNMLFDYKVVTPKTGT
tara:strand:+ start:40 stop:429 length:390 start_codon:yes stop_codon:yes gene_type:complete